MVDSDYQSTVYKYENHLDATVRWLQRSIEKGGGGSCAYFGVWGRWSRPYPETTGYIIPTLISYHHHADSGQLPAYVRSLGNWLLDVQQADGYWNSGHYHPKQRTSPSVFNTAQILKGLCALYRETGEEKWLEAAIRAANWLANSASDDGTWLVGNYYRDFNPSYYTQVAWPMLEVWKFAKDDKILKKAMLVLQNIAKRIQKNGAIMHWGFKPGKPAFTHTIAYTIRGFQESARILEEWNKYGMLVYKTLDILARKMDLSNGRLPGAFDENWREANSYTCLTGNAQIAICLLNYYEYVKDLNLFNSACKLIDNVCNSQSLSHPVEGIRGGVAGSKPIWGKYMFLRYPNWAAKYHCDALMKLLSTPAS